MTSLPISIPPGFSPVVKKGFHVHSGDLLAQSDEDNRDVPEDAPSAENEVSIDLAQALGTTSDKARKLLQKGPGDSIEKGDIIAVMSTGFGFKKEQIISEVTGTILRFERDTGRLIVKSNSSSSSLSPKPSVSEIRSPLDGKVTVCNNDEIVIEPDEVSQVKKEHNVEENETKEPALLSGSTFQGTIGRGGEATGIILTLSPEAGEQAITGNQITKEAIGKILLLPDIQKEAVTKASAIGVAGILTTEPSEDLFGYLKLRSIDLPVIAIDASLGKKLIKNRERVQINGERKSITV